MLPVYGPVELEHRSEGEADQRETSHSVSHHQNAGKPHAEQAGQMALQCSTAAEVMKIAGNVLAKVAPEVVALVEDGNDS